jgi:hypothetical protein
MAGDWDIRYGVDGTFKGELRVWRHGCMGSACTHMNGLESQPWSGLALLSLSTRQRSLLHRIICSK